MDSVGIGELPDAAGTAIRAATRSATSRDGFRCSCRRCARWGSRASPRSAARRRRPPEGGRRPDGRSVGRQGFGHGPLGDDGHRARSPVSGVPERLFRGRHRGVRAANGPRRARQQGRVGHRDHRRARPRAHADRRAHRLHVGRQRVSDRRARRRRAGSRALSRVRDRLRAGGRGLGVGRVIARPFVGTPGTFHAHRQPPRLRAAARRRDAARSREGGVAAGRRDRQDRGSVRGPRHHARHSHHERRRRDGSGRAGDGRRSSAA